MPETAKEVLKKDAGNVIAKLYLAFENEQLGEFQVVRAFPKQGRIPCTMR